jgi:hypothetical protein
LVKLKIEFGDLSFFEGFSSEIWQVRNSKYTNYFFQFEKKVFSFNEISPLKKRSQKVLPLLNEFMN